jgi:xanthine dehydrogenase accessory factor
MVQMNAPILQATPVRASSNDDPVDLLRFAIDAFHAGPVALATLVEIRGGAARALGSHVAVAADGRFCGYVSGGCVEAAVAAEALLAMAQGQDRLVKFGDGSPFFDIILPCGGGISVAIHVVRDPQLLHEVLDRLRQRGSASLSYSSQRQRLRLTDVPLRTGWEAEEFRIVYRPRTRLLISGQTSEAEAVARLAEASAYDVVQIRPFSSDERYIEEIDPFTAIVLLHHDLEAEVSLLQAALHSPAFYIGALGSTRTHRRRVERLRTQSFRPEDIGRIKAPIGIFGPTRDATSLALSVLADVAASRLATFG